MESAKKLYNVTMDQAAKKMSVTRTEIDILLFLANNPQYDTAADIVKVRHLTKSHVSTSVDSLVRMGMLERIYKEGNSKTIHLNIMPSAQKIIDEGRSVQEEFIGVLLDGIDPKDIRLVSRVFEHMGENIAKAFDKEK